MTVHSLYTAASSGETHGRGGREKQKETRGGKGQGQPVLFASLYLVEPSPRRVER